MIPAAEVSDIGAAAGDEVEQAVERAHEPGRPGYVAPTAPTGCATVDDETDTDGDFAPDAATYTFALPACSFTGFRGGTLEITGTIVLSDPTPDAADLAATATLTDFTFAFTSPDARPHLHRAPERHPHADRQRPGRLAQQPDHRGAEPRRIARMPPSCTTCC